MSNKISALTQIDKEIFIEFMKGNIDEKTLEPKVVDHYNRLKTTNDLLQENNRIDTANKLIAEYGYGLSTAHRDIRDAQVLFVKLDSINREYYRVWAADRLQRNIFLLENMLHASPVVKPPEQNEETDDDQPLEVIAYDPRLGAAKLADSITRMHKEFRETIGWDKEENMAPKWEDLQMPDILYGYFPKQFMDKVRVPKDIEQRIIDLSGIDEAEVIDE